MANGILTVSYHQESTVPLTQEEQRELDSLLRPLRVEVDFDPFENRATPSQLMSLAGDVARLMIVVGGTLATKTLLQELVKDLYRFAKERVTKQKKRAGYLAVVLDVECEGKRYHVGVDFEDETTVKIGFFRLHAYLSRPAAHRPEAGLHRIKFPTTRGGPQALAAALAALALAIVQGARRWPPQPSPRTTEIWPPSPETTALLAAFGTFLVTYLVVAIGLFVLSDRITRWKYRRTYGRDAERWVLDLEPLPGLPEGTRVQVRTGRRTPE